MTSFPKPITELRLAICGLARDCLPSLRRNWSAMQDACGKCREVHWIIVENDSVDGTREWLESMSRVDPRVHVIGEKVGRASIPSDTGGTQRPWFSLPRIGLMASLRNQYLTFIRESIGWENFDVVIVVDFDVHRLPVERISHVLEAFDGSTMVSAFGVHWIGFFQRGFYDSFAYLENENELPLREDFLLNRRRPLFEKYDASADPCEVVSNFNALAIYPASFMAGARYAAEPNDDPHVGYLCEHIPLHRVIRSLGCRIMIDPKLRVTYDSIPAGWRSLAGKWIKRPGRK